MKKDLGFQVKFENQLKFDRKPETAHGINFNDLLVAKLDVGVRKRSINFSRIRRDLVDYVFLDDPDDNAYQSRLRSLDKSRDAIEYLWNLRDYHALYSKYSKNRRFRKMQNGIERLINDLIFDVDFKFPESKDSLQDYLRELKEEAYLLNQ